MPDLYPGLRIETRRTYSELDVQLFALGCGRGLRPRAPNDLACLVNPNPAVLPGFALILGHGAGLFTGRGLGWGSLLVLSQDLDCISPLPSAGEVACTDEVTGLVPEPAKGATVVTVLTSVCIVGKLAARVSTRWLVRGFLAAIDHKAPHDATAALRRQTSLLGKLSNDLQATVKSDIPTSPQAALIFRLLGGHSPLHSDPKTAQAAGFEGPILHGPSVLGHVLAALAEEHACFDLPRIRSIGCDFVGPLYPGEMLRSDSRKTCDGIAFEASSQDRSRPVLRGGLMTLS